jgi:hypothetical protein
MNSLTLVLIGALSVIVVLQYLNNLKTANHSNCQSCPHNPRNDFGCNGIDASRSANSESNLIIQTLLVKLLDMVNIKMPREVRPKGNVEKSTHGGKTKKLKGNK